MILYIILHFLAVRVGVMFLPPFYILDRNWKSVYFHEKYFTDMPIKYLLLLLVCFFSDFFQCFLCNFYI